MMHACAASKKGIRSQAAIEYISTYAWAILVIAVIAGLLYYFASLPNAIVPSQCAVSQQIYCSDLILGTNTVSHSTSVLLLLTNTQIYPILNPKASISISGQNSTYYPCQPNYVLAGGAAICTVNLTQKTTLGQQLNGIIYLNAIYCGLGSSPANTLSCNSLPAQVYSGTFSAHASAMVSTANQIAVSLAAAGTSWPADGSADKLTATVTIWGIPLKGATVNFTSNTVSTTINPKSSASASNGIATSYASSTTAGSVSVHASFANLIDSSNVVIQFT